MKRWYQYEYTQGDEIMFCFWIIWGMAIVAALLGGLIGFIIKLILRL